MTTLCKGNANIYLKHQFKMIKVRIAFRLHSISTFLYLLSFKIKGKFALATLIQNCISFNLFYIYNDVI